MTLKNLKNKKICILGLGLENYALIKFLLKKKVKADITVCDSRTKKELRERYGACAKGVHCKLGIKYDEHLNKYDIIFRVAGYPLFSKKIIKAMMAGTEISSPTKLFFDLCPTNNIIGITGTKGKGTTASIIYQILTDAGRRTYFGGNIGIPIFGFFDKIRPGDWVVLELSSFQLEDLHKSPRIAVFTNFFQDHLSPADPDNPNHHKTLKTYWDAKSNIFSHQNKKDVLIANLNLKEYLKAYSLKARIKYFETSSLETKLIGSHNKKNIAAAVLAAQAAGINKTDINKSIKHFKGLEHRLEFVKIAKDVRYYNDSFSTNPDTAIIAISTFQPGSVILIAGGSDKGSNFDSLAKTIKKYVKYTILLPGKGTLRMKQSLKNINYKKITGAGNMTPAVKIAREKASRGDVILLSPGCASFGIFKNYKERGHLFKKEVIK